MFQTRLLCAALLAAAPLQAGAGLPRPDGHAPIGVMGDHLHHTGELMFSYRYSRMSMDDNQSGTRHRSAREVVGTAAAPGRFMAVPTDMEMEMHMIGAMFAPHARVTLVGMLPLLRLRMDHLRRDGVRFTTASSGVGDVRAGALIGLFDTGTHAAHLNAGLSFPTGSTSRRDGIPGMPATSSNRVRLPYPMQLGSGTWDFVPGATYRGRSGDLSWGAQALATVRTGRNRRGYRLGDRLEATSWLAWQWADWVSTSARVAWAGWQNIDGEDDLLNPAMVPTADPNRRAGHRVELLAGLNLVVPLGRAGRHRLALEYGRPVYQWLDGPQLDTSWRLVLGWQSAFHWKLPGFE